MVGYVNRARVAVAAFGAGALVVASAQLCRARARPLREEVDLSNERGALAGFECRRVRGEPVGEPGKQVGRVVRADSSLVVDEVAAQECAVEGGVGPGVELGCRGRVGEQNRVGCDVLDVVAVASHRRGWWCAQPGPGLWCPASMTSATTSWTNSQAARWLMPSGAIDMSFLQPNMSSVQLAAVVIRATTMTSPCNRTRLRSAHRHERTVALPGRQRRDGTRDPIGTPPESRRRDASGCNRPRWPPNITYRHLTDGARRQDQAHPVRTAFW